MRSTKKNIFFLINFMILLNPFNTYYLAQTKKVSMMKLFCLNSFKQEMLKAEIEYSEDIANETCECYLEEFVQKASHNNAITKCKLEAKEKIKKWSEN